MSKTRHDKPSYLFAGSNGTFENTASYSWSLIICVRFYYGSKYVLMCT